MYILYKQVFHFLSCFILSSKRDNELLLRLIANLNMLLKDEGVNVVKKAILTLTQLYKVTLQVKTLLAGLIFDKDKLSLISLVFLHSAFLLPVVGSLKNSVREAGGMLGSGHTNERGRPCLAGL